MKILHYGISQVEKSRNKRKKSGSGAHVSCNFGPSIYFFIFRLASLV